jgi:hypothetical protein
MNFGRGLWKANDWIPSDWGRKEKGMSDKRCFDPSTKFDVAPLRFYDQRRKQDMMYVYPDTKHELAGWLLYKHPDGQWVTLRKASDADVERLGAMVVSAHHLEVQP